MTDPIFPFQTPFSHSDPIFQERVSSSVTVEYVRGSDYGGGVGGILYTLRGGTPSYTHYNNRGDVVAKTNDSGALTYEAAYEAFGTRTVEQGSTADRQKANTKDEDPTGLLNEGFRYRDLETGTFITRDPLGFVDGPNMYAYVVQNPWSKFDPTGLNMNDMNSAQDAGNFMKGSMVTGPIKALKGIVSHVMHGGPIGDAVESVPKLHGALTHPDGPAAGIKQVLHERSIEAGKMADALVQKVQTSEGKGEITFGVVTIGYGLRGSPLAAEAETVGGAKYFRRVSEADRAALEAGEGLRPKGTDGTILEHVRGSKPTDKISASETAEATKRFDSGNGLIEIDAAKAEATGSKIIPHDKVVEGVGNRPKQVQKVKEAKEVLIEGGISREAIKIIEEKKD